MVQLYYQLAYQSIMHQALEKPQLGSPCNGCGACCLAERCPLSVAAFGEDESLCPAIEQEGLAFRCGLIVHPEQYLDLGNVGGYEGDVFAQLLGVGRGCDSQD